jgi:hypothetical protein
MLGWDRYGFIKKRARTHCAKLVFLHQVGYACNVVHSDVSGDHNDEALFFMLGWERYGFDIKHVGPQYTELVFWYPVGSACRIVHSCVSRA